MKSSPTSSRAHKPLLVGKMFVSRHAALLLLLWPLTGLAGTFELSDPAAEVYAEKQDEAEPQEPEQESIAMEEVFCAVDEREGKCWCVHRETAKVVTIEHEQCIILASKVSSANP